MPVGKIAILVIYAIMAFLAISQPDSGAGIWSLRILVIIALVHCVEVAIFYKACRAAGGSLAGHLVNVFLFGVLHMKDIKGPAGA